MRRAIARRAGVRPRRNGGARRPGTAPRLAGASSRSGSRRERHRGGVTVAAAVAFAVLAWLLWPASSTPQAAIAPPHLPAPVAAAHPARKAPVRPPAPAPAPAQPEIDEARLRAAVLARAADLRACAVPAGSPGQVPVRLRVPSSGEIRSVQLLASESLPPELAGCLRERLLHWRFDDLQLASDVDLFITFALR